jgi:hypothetical protein
MRWEYLGKWFFWFLICQSNDASSFLETSQLLQQIGHVLRQRSFK